MVVRISITKINLITIKVDLYMIKLLQCLYLRKKLLHVYVTIIISTEYDNTKIKSPLMITIIHKSY